MKPAPILAMATLLVFATCASAGNGPTTISPRARAVQAQAINLDTHLDTPALFSNPGWKITDRHSYQADGSQVDYPRMVEGGLDGGFWVVFTGQGDRDAVRIGLGLVDDRGLGGLFVLTTFFFVGAFGFLVGMR